MQNILGYDKKHRVSAANPLSIPVAIIGALMYVELEWNVMPCSNIAILST